MCAEHQKAAALLYNDLDGPIIHLGPGRQGKSEADDILGNLEAAERTISRALQDSTSSLPPQIVDGVGQLLKALPFPQSLLFEDGWLEVTPPEDALTLIVSVREFLARQIEVQPRGNARAFRTALALRAAYEHYTHKPITVGHDKASGPVGDFCRCLSEVFELVGLQPKVVDLASRAKRCHETDELLMRYRAYFAHPIGRVGHHEMLFTKVGWVENMTFREKLRNLLAMKCRRLEYLQCQNICSSGRAYTTTPTWSLMSSRLVRSAHSGAIAALARLF
ncbi:hypothetical protein Q4543_24285 [Salipiger sp. 1_MG-2023]|uniref:hypothetical protein n=1 Tax=Salipiger sp. 1_MG-2023 TaxID=3062665 RepID=UPI0026E269DC|nr:hypothetical protein [Salipiger sp. 1_MG-2023]MDO6588567.1 hypothetical protein [Salipiger sp. 1_MG-2023]